MTDINRFFFAYLSLKKITVAMAMLIFFASTNQKIIQFIYQTWYNKQKRRISPTFFIPLNILKSLFFYNFHFL